MNVYLRVPYEFKDQAKSYGARWDAARKQWFFPGTEADLPEWLSQFLPTAEAAAKTSTGPAFYRCPSCGVTGRGGDYPFSTCPPTCDDCN